MRAGDRIIAIDGRRIENAFSLIDTWARHRPGDAVELTVERRRLLHRSFSKLYFAPLARFKRGKGSAKCWPGHRPTYPVGFLVVGLAVLFLRLEDPNAWLLALMFAGFIAIPGPENSFAGLNPSLRSFALAYRGVFDNMVAPLFYFFFAVFPTRSPLDRRVPWLKWISLLVGACCSGARCSNAATGPRHVFVLLFLYGLIVFGFASLIANAFSATTPEARRKIRVILWGTLVGVVPATLVLGAGDFFNFHEPLFLDVVIVILLWLFPLSFAYAVVKHRVLEIPVLLRRSARYLLVQRGFTILLLAVSAWP